MTTRVLIDLPSRMAKLPRDERGYPVPKFVEWIDGKPDFRVIDSRHLVKCVNHNLCWLCGEVLGRYKAFVIGPMCAVNRINSEPPSHYECARFAARNCPFLTRPLAKRNERNLIEDRVQAAGMTIDRNPGCCAIWVTSNYKPFRPHAGRPGILFQLGEPDRIEFWAQGRLATLTEVKASVDSGLHFLEESAKEEGHDAERALVKQVEAFNKMLNDTIGLR